MNPEINQEISSEIMSEAEREMTHKAMNAMARILDDILNGKGTPRDEKQFGFALMIYPFGHIDRAHINYVGTGERNDVLTALKELVARWEGRTPQTTETRQ